MGKELGETEGMGLGCWVGALEGVMEGKFEGRIEGRREGGIDVMKVGNVDCSVALDEYSVGPLLGKDVVRKVVSDSMRRVGDGESMGGVEVSAESRPGLVEGVLGCTVKSSNSMLNGDAVHI